MTAEYDVKSVLLDLMKEGENKICADCDTPMPQWASLAFGIFVCLTCSGAHRGLGVHITLTRSITMDKWTETQLTKMKVGGNAKCKAFFKSQPGYDPSMAIADKYQSHFAAMYKDKLLAEIEGRPWSPSDTPAPASIDTSSSLRKPRSAQSSRGASPAPGRSNTSHISGQIDPPGRTGSPLSPGSSGGLANPYNQKAQNESYFAKQGALNESRPDHLPPSQGGKYSGFGSEGSFNPSNATSSRALPGIDDFRSDPASALGRGWGFLGAALSQVSATINENVVQPTMERAVDPNLQSQFSGYLGKATQVLGEASRRGGEVLASGLQSGSGAIRDLGYDVGDLGASRVERVTGRGAGQGYGQVGYQVPSAEQQEQGESDFFGSQLGNDGYSPSMNNTSPSMSIGGAYDAAPASANGGGAEDAWAKMAPQSAGRKLAAPATGGRSTPGSGRASPARKLGATVQKKNDDWDDFGTSDWKD